jgi:hemolysin III
MLKVDRVELFNGLSHLAGAILALFGTVALVVSAVAEGNGVKVVSFLIYGLTLCLLYFMSAFYHIRPEPSKQVFRILEHQAIYLLIAGTYTPFALVTMQDRLGWGLFGAIWGMAILGILIDVRLKTKRRVIPTTICLLMGWLVVIALDPLMQALPAAGFQWLLAGGIFYTAGVVFFALSHWYARAHAVWHLFVLGGSVSHFFAIFWYV